MTDDKLDNDSELAHLKLLGSVLARATFNTKRKSNLLKAIVFLVFFCLGPLL